MSDETPTDPSLPRFVTEITDAEQRFLHVIEDLAAAGTLTEDDRDQLSFEIGVLSAELRACLDPGAWEEPRSMDRGRT